MRVLLVRPPIPRHTMGLKHIMVCEPLELEYLAAGLPDHEVHILDLILERGLDRTLKRFRPHVVATSAYITGVNEAIRVCRAAKRWNPEVWTVAGGVHASRAPADFVDGAVDVIALGDGTTLLPELLEGIQKGRMLEEIPGLALPSNPLATSEDPDTLSDCSREFVLTPNRPYMPHPDTLPFPRRDLTAHLRKRYYYLTHRPLALVKTTWGCGYRCNFCFNWKVTDGKVFSRGPESIVEELASIQEQEIYIVDDIFLVGQTRLRRLAELIRESGIKKNFLCFGRSDFIAANEDLIAEWAELGLKAVLVGLEASTDEELEGMKKRSSVDQNRSAIEVLRRNGVATYGSLIPHPSYEPEQWNQLWHFIDANDLYYLNISPLTPLPGTDLWAELGHLTVVPREAHGLWDLSHVVLPTKRPLKEFYRSLLRVYVRAILDVRRAKHLGPFLNNSPRGVVDFLRMWLGAIRIWMQFRRAHLHHEPEALRKAQDRGDPVGPFPRRLRRAHPGSSPAAELDAACRPLSTSLVQPQQE